jgi:hypothetical protein
VLALAALGAAAPATSAAADRIFTAAGTGVQGFSGEGGPAGLGDMNHPRGLAALPDGGFLIAEAFGHRIRRVLPDGRVATVAGTGVKGFSGDGGPATSARLNTPHAVAPLPDGGFLIDDTNSYRIRRVWPDGRITTVAGTGVKGFSGDGGPATAARISAPRGMCATPDGGYLIADSDNQRVRRVSPDGTITTVAGTGVKGFSGDGGPATSARLNLPFGVAALPGGGFLIAEPESSRIRRVSPGGTITTVAGTGVRGFSGDGGPATSARLDGPHNVEPLPDGGFLIADNQNHRVREVSAEGNIRTVAGTGSPGFGGEGGPPGLAQLDMPKSIMLFNGGLLVADSNNNRVRFIGAGPWPAPAPGSGTIQIDDAAAYATDAAVSVSAEAQVVSAFRLSNSPAMSGETLTLGVTYNSATPVAWDLADPATGGSGANGVRYVYVQWQDEAGNWSSVKRDSIVLDTVAPRATAPAEGLTKGTVLGASTVPVKLSWSGSDVTSGIARYDLEQSTSGGAFTAVSPAPGASKSLTRSLAPGGDYAFRVRAVDRAGNVGTWAVGRTFPVDLLEESAPSVTFGGSWAFESLGSASGGGVAYATSVDATATLDFVGRRVAWVAPTGPTRGSVEVYLDGTSVATVSLYSPAAASRKLVYEAKWANAGRHSLRIRNLATPGRPRVDVDAFAVLG